MAYAEKRAANPGALGLTIGLNVAAVLALAAWNPNFLHVPKDPWKTIHVGPPPPLPPPPDDTTPRQKHVIDQLKPEIDTGAITKTAIDQRVFPDPPTVQTFDPGPDLTKIVIPDQPPPPIHEPVKRGATMATSPDDMQPPYPPALQRAEVQGSVVVRVLVGEDGHPRDIQLVRTDDPGFFAAAKTWGMRHWRFKPGTEDGRPVETWFTLNVRFTIS